MSEYTFYFLKSYDKGIVIYYYLHIQIYETITQQCLFPENDIILWLRFSLTEEI